MDSANSSPVTRLLSAVSRIVMALASVLMVILIFIFGWLVFGRYVLNATPTWVEQASLLIVVWITFLGAAIGVRHKSHLSVELVRDALPETPRKIITVLAILIMAAFGVIMAWQGYVMYGRTFTREIPLLGISEGWRSVPIIIGGALIAVFSIERLFFDPFSDGEI